MSEKVDFARAHVESEGVDGDIFGQDKMINVTGIFRATALKVNRA